MQQAFLEATPIRKNICKGLNNKSFLPRWLKGKVISLVTLYFTVSLLHVTCTVVTVVITINYALTKYYMLLNLNQTLILYLTL